MDIPDVCRSLSATPWARRAFWTAVVAVLAEPSAELTLAPFAVSARSRRNVSGVPAMVPVPVTVMPGVGPFVGSTVSAFDRDSPVAATAVAGPPARELPRRYVASSATATAATIAAVRARRVMVMSHGRDRDRRGSVP